MKTKTKFTLISLLLILVLSAALIVPSLTVYADTDNSAGQDIGESDGDVDGDGIIEESGKNNGGVIGDIGDDIESGMENVESGVSDIGSDIASGFGTEGDTDNNKEETDPGVVSSDTGTQTNDNGDTDDDDSRMGVTGIIIAIIIAVAVIAIIIALIPKKKDQ